MSHRSSKIAPYQIKTGQVLMVRAPVLEPIDLGSILARGFLEGHDFTTCRGRFGGRPPYGAESVDLAYNGLGDIVSLYSRAASTTPSTCFALCALNECCNQFKFKSKSVKDLPNM
jgi:hypothetical protein